MGSVMDRKQKIKNGILQNKVFILFLAGMVLYYGYNMFHIKPWYDELYTYYSFIARGPVYAAIHWPVPNNHVMYSVLSACLDVFGNPYIGLRGISFLAACANLCLLYVFAGRFLDRSLAAGCTFLYAAAWLVNNQSVQGRGYTLSVTFYLIVLLCLEKICRKQASGWTYVIYACSLTGGLYTLISSTFWVIPVCLTGGIVLLFTKEYKTLGKLIAASVAAAGMTLCLYAVIWLAIGSNLMCKDPDNLYYGIYQVKIILAAPFQALRTGMEYMLATPYIQGKERGVIIAELFSYLKALFRQFYAGTESILVIFCALTGLLGGVSALCFQKKDKKKWFFGCYLFVTVLMLPLMLIIQSVQPYYRVFTFFAVPVALLVAWALQEIGDHMRHFAGIGGIFAACLFGISLFFLTQEGYNTQYSERETQIAQIVEDEIESMDTIFYADDYQKYVFKFYYDKELIETGLEEAGYVLLPKEILEEDYDIPVWPTLYAQDAIDLSYLENSFEICRESDAYRLYRRKK